MTPQEIKQEIKLWAGLKDQKIKIKFQARSKKQFESLLNFVKTLPGRRFEPETKTWFCPLLETTIKQLIDARFKITPKLQNWYQTKQNQIEIKFPEGLGLYPFQKEGVKFIEKNNGRVLIGDEMGLGKTLQALTWINLHPEIRPVVIICPASLKLNWQREAQKWYGYFPHIVSGIKTHSLQEYSIIIINYDILSKWTRNIQNSKPKLLILDECHYIKSRQAQRTKAVKTLSKNIPHIIALSGTPIINRPAEIYNTIKLINSSITPKWGYFMRRYCNAYHNGFGWDISGASNTEELNKILTSSIMIRRLKKEVLKDLPDKTRSLIALEIKRSTYDRAESDFIQWVRETKGNKAANKAKNAEALVRVEGLKQIAVKEKLDQVLSWIQDFLETDQKLVIFAAHKNTIQTIFDKYKKIAVKLDGSTSLTNKQKAIDSFQNNSKIRLFIGNIKAAGTGINLTAASNTLFVELGWSPGEHDQAEDRVHRIGQEDKVNIYYLLAENTIEEKIDSLIDKKRQVLDAVLDNQGTTEFSLLTKLLKLYQKEEIKNG